MHDFGKLSKVFQEQMKCIINNRKPKYYFRHELLSTFYTIFINKEDYKNWEKEFPFVNYIILSHHKRLNALLSEFNREFKEDVWPKLLEEEYNYGINLVEKNCYKTLQVGKQKDFTIYSHSIKILLEKHMSVTYFKKLADNHGFTQKNARALYSLAKGLLQYCDWVASSDNEPMEQVVSQEELIGRIKTKVINIGNKYEEREFHKKCTKAIEDIVVIAPTGSGKTEASLLWATNREKCNIMFLMPTMVTSNSIFKRLLFIF